MLAVVSVKSKAVETPYYAVLSRVLRKRDALLLENVEFPSSYW